MLHPFPREDTHQPESDVDDRFYFEGEDYGDRHQNRVDVEDGPFAQVRIGTRF